jgi:phenylpyruvate tautomerase PptA (4-oxalocrotonate tautomerase family)
VLAMAQVTIYGERHHLNRVRAALSQAVHECLVDALQLPDEKRFQRFLPMAAEDFLHPRGAAYTIVEISMFEGRTGDTKRALITALYQRWRQLDLDPDDLEITIFETPRGNWGIRGVPGDELILTYPIGSQLDSQPVDSHPVGPVGLAG